MIGRRQVSHVRRVESRTALCGYETTTDIPWPARRICGECLAALFEMASGYEEQRKHAQRLLGQFDRLTLALNEAADAGKKIGPVKARRFIVEALGRPTYSLGNPAGLATEVDATVLGSAEAALTRNAIPRRYRVRAHKPASKEQR